MAVAASVVIPTLNRSRQLSEAVASALHQTVGDHEVVVIDDGSVEPVCLASDPRLRVVRLDVNRGVSAARNVGLAVAAGRWITYLDDDDLLLPQHLELALNALDATDLPAPVATLSGVEIINSNGRCIETRLPPTLPRGARFSLEETPAGRSFATKSSLVVEREVLQGVGGWDETLRSRVQTELFLRLNPACSLLGIPVVTYQRRRHDGPRVSGDPLRRKESLARLEVKHREMFAAHPGRHAEMMFHQSVKLWLGGRRGPALATWARALRLHPGRTARCTADISRYCFDRVRRRSTTPSN